MSRRSKKPGWYTDPKEFNRAFRSFENDVRRLAARTFARDEDGHLPVSIKIINRVQDEIDHYDPIPHVDRCKTEESHNRRLNLLLSNALLAMERLRAEIERRRRAVTGE